MKVQEISRDLGDKKQEAHACLMLGNTFLQLKQNEKAIQSYQKALNISEDMQDVEIQVNAAHRLGFIAFDTHQYEEALKYSKILVELTDGPKQALAQKNLGLCYVYLERFKEGLACFEKSLEIICNSSERGQEGIINEWCGYCCRFLKDRHEEAIEFYVKAKAIAKQAGEKVPEYRSSQVIGDILSDTGGYEKAKEYYEYALKIAKEIRDKHCEGTTCLNLGSVCCKNCDYELAMKWYTRALAIFTTVDPLMEERARTGLAVSWFKLGNVEKAIALLQEVQKLNQNEGT